MPSSSPGVTETLHQEKTTAPYVSWKSPITADIVTGAAKRLGGTAVNSRGRLVWLESRPTESGRGVLVGEGERPGDEPTDITPEFAAFRISPNDIIVFSNYKDQRL